jgi:hypothetical protein
MTCSTCEYGIDFGVCQNKESKRYMMQVRGISLYHNLVMAACEKHEVAKEDRIEIKDQRGR